MRINYDRLPKDTIMDRVAREILASRGIQTGLKEMKDRKGRVIGHEKVVIFGNLIPKETRVFRDQKGRPIKAVSVVKGFLRD